MNRSKHLLQFNVTANWGSTGRIAEGIGLHAQKRGWESAIAYGRNENPSNLKLFKIGRMADVYIHYARHFILDQEGLGSYIPTIRSLNTLSDYNPDIVHLHNIHDHWLNYPLLFNWLASKKMPIVWTFHDCWAFTGGCAHFESSNCFKWRDSCHKCPKKRRFAIDRSNLNFIQKKKSFGALADRLTIVAVSEWIAEYVRQSFLGNCRIEIINNGIDTDRFTPDSSPQKERFILGVSNVWPDYKGLPDFVKLRKLLPDNIGIVLVGLTDKQIKTLPDGIRGLTRTSNIDELINLYRKAKVFVNPTHNDTFPTVNLEALSCGTPVITYHTGGSPEAVDTETGVVIEKGDVGSLANEIENIVNNHKKFNLKACRDRAVSRFNNTIQFGKYIDLYENLLSR